MKKSMQRLTDTQQEAVERILKKIDPILQGEDDSVAISALMFYVIAVIQEQQKLSPTDAAQYAAHHLKNYATMIGYGD